MDKPKRHLLSDEGLDDLHEHFATCQCPHIVRMTVRALDELRERRKAEITPASEEIAELRKFVQLEYQRNDPFHPYSLELAERHPWLKQS